MVWRRKLRVTIEQALEALRGVMDTELSRGIVGLGRVEDLTIEDGKISFTLALTTPTCPLRTRVIVKLQVLEWRI